MMSFLFVLSLVWPVSMIALVFYIDEHIREWIKDRNRIAQLRWESEQVQGILNNMSEEGVLQKMTSIERIELHELLAKEYPLWYSIYGKEMTYIPRNV